MKISIGTLEKNVISQRKKLQNLSPDRRSSDPNALAPLPMFSCDSDVSRRPDHSRCASATDAIGSNSALAHDPREFLLRAPVLSLQLQLSFGPVLRRLCFPILAPY